MIDFLLKKSPSTDFTSKSVVKRGNFNAKVYPPQAIPLLSDGPEMDANEWFDVPVA